LAWRQLTAQGFSIGKYATPPSSFFYIITGFHALHMIVGVAALVFCLVGLGMFRRVEYRQIAIDSAAWWWHMGGVAWLVLWGVLALGQ
jgi:cytochrome c oxidase subunit 3